MQRYYQPPNEVFQSSLSGAAIDTYLRVIFLFSINKTKELLIVKGRLGRRWGLLLPLPLLVELWSLRVRGLSFLLFLFLYVIRFNTYFLKNTVKGGK